MNNSVKKNIFLTIMILFLALGIFGKTEMVQAGCCAEMPKSKVDKASSIFKGLSTGSFQTACQESTNNSCLDGMKLIDKNLSCKQIKEAGEEISSDGFKLGCSSIKPAPVASACCVNYCTSTTIGSTCSDGSAPVSGSCSEIDACNNSSASTSTNTIEFANPIGFNSFSGLLSSVLSNLMGLIAILAVIFIVIGGILYITSGGNETRVTQAKKTWTGAVIGLAIALSAPTFLKEIQSILNKNANMNGNADNWVSNALTIKEIAVNVLNFLLSIFGILATIALVIGGVMYLTAYGDEKKIDDGKKIFRYAIIGIVVSLSALIIVRQIGNILGAQMN